MDDREDLFEAYLDGSLDAADKQRLERLLEDHETRVLFVERLRLEGELRLLRARSLEPALAESTPRPPIPVSWRQCMVAVGLAAAATVLLTVARGAFSGPSQRDAPPARPVTLADGGSAASAEGGTRPSTVQRAVSVTVTRSGGQARVASSLRPGDAFASVDSGQVHHYGALRCEADYTICLVPIRRTNRGGEVGHDRSQ
ncbi:MAG: hypothetical protein ACOCZK_05230 [Planctomycetota bacterium]